MALKRQKYWDTRAYPAFLAARAKVPFAWGTYDCLMSAADGMLAICGAAEGSADDPALGFRGAYSDAAGAVATMQAFTGSADMLTAVTFVANRLGLVKRANPLMAQRGDVVLVEDAGRLICALVGLSGGVAHAPGDVGLDDVSITQALHAWTY